MPVTGCCKVLQLGNREIFPWPVYLWSGHRLMVANNGGCKRDLMFKFTIKFPLCDQSPPKGLFVLRFPCFYKITH